MKKLLSFLTLVILFFFINLVSPAKSFAAARVYFDPSSINTSSGNNFDVNINIDTDSKEVFGTEVVINYPSSNVEVKSITNGGFFPDFNSVFDSSKIVIRAYSSSPYDNKKGTGNVAKITFLSKVNSQSSASFICGGSSETQIIDSSGQNILSCSVLNQLSIISSTNQPTNPPTNPPGTPNSCGGTCGSNTNCQSGLFCYNGFCRNPSCPNDLDCVCDTTITVTAKPTYKPKSTIKPTQYPQEVTLEEYTEPSPTEEAQPLPLTEEEIKKTGFSKYIPYLLLLILFIFIILFFKNKKKKTDDIPPITDNLNPVEPVVKPTDDFSSQNQIQSNPTSSQDQQFQQSVNEGDNPPSPPIDNQNSNI